MSYITYKCRSCQSKNLSPILSLGNQYLSDFRSNKSKPKKFPLELILCSDCKLVQLKHTTPQLLLYTERYGYKSGINQTMKDELKEIAKKSIERLASREKKIIVVDIGANDGTLLSFYPKRYFKVGVEPVKKLAKECKKNANKVVNDFFNIKSYKAKMGKKKANIVSAISCFYDMEEPNKFVEDVKNILHPEGIFVIQQNYLLEMLNNNAFDNIVHEHLEYYSLLSLENLLKKFDLEVFDLELSDLNGGSIRTYICNKGQKRIRKSVIRQREIEQKSKLESDSTYNNFSSRVKKNADKIYEFIKEKAADGKTVYIYGASTRGNTLVQYLKLNNKLIKAAVERNPEKWGKFVSSISLPIISEAQARKEKPDFMLVLPWFFQDEFVKREKKYLDAGGHFIFPLPSIKVV